MATRTSKSYMLHVSSINKLEWPQNYFQRNSPNLYVEVQLEKSVQRTKVVNRCLMPKWDEKLLLLGKDTSTLSLSVKHNTSRPLVRNPCVGSIDIEVSRLFQMCKNNQDATLELRSREGKACGMTKGFITVRLCACDPAQAGSNTVSKACEDIERRGVAKSPASESFRATDTVGEPLRSIVSKLSAFVDIIDKTSKLHPYANFAWQVVASLYKVVKGQIERDQNLIELLMTMDDVCSFVDAIQSIPNKIQLLEDVITDILKQTVECAIFIREYTSHGFAARVIGQTLSNTDQVIENLTKHLIALKHSFDSGVSLQTVFVSTRTLEDVDKLVKIESLKRLNSVEMNASSRSECLPDTRQDLLKSITDWLTTPSAGQNVFWLHGLAGSGKSTISTTIAEYFRELGRLGAFIFFEHRKHPLSREPAVVIPTLCEQLATFDPAIKAAVCAQIERDPSITKASMRVQFAKLLREPLGSLVTLHTQGPIIIVVDAFDKCGNSESRKQLLALLAHDLAKFPPIFRFLITSRREFDIETAFSRSAHVVARELDIMNQANTADISSYLHHHLASFRKNPLFQLESHWPGNEKIQALTESSAGLFVWVSTAVKFIAEGYHPDRQLEILVRPHPREAESALDELYATALHAAGNWDRVELAVDFRAVLGAIVTGREPLSDTTLDHMLDLEGSRSSRFILSRLLCLLQWTQGQAAKTLHSSFADYLTDARRCGNQPWFIDLSAHHQRLAFGCFRIMKTELKFNICKLETSHVFNDEVPDIESRIKDHVSVHLSYACRFWADHVRESEFMPVCQDVNEFLSYRFLFWLEVLSLMKEVRVAPPALLSIADWAIHHKDEALARNATDARILVSTFRYPISESVPHIYVSAVPFSPTKSWVSKQFRPYFSRCLSVTVGIASDWPSILYVLEGHNDGVSSVAFSADGQQIASGSWDQTIRVWDAKTGEVVAGPFEGHTSLIWSVAFSPDGQQIVSGSSDQTVRVWDVKTGEVAAGPFEGHMGPVRTVAFSPDGQKIISGSSDQTVCVWDAKTGEVIAGPLNGHTGSLLSVAFSPDGQYIVSGSSDQTVRVWDMRTGEVMAWSFEGHKARVWSIAVSPDGQKIVSGSDDQTVCVWDVKTGNALAMPFTGHTGRVSSVAFSPDGQYIVSGSSDQTVRVRDARTGEVVAGPFEGHMGYISSVAFSPNGQQIISGSWDKTVCIWDMKTGEVVADPLTGHTSSLWSVAFSPNGLQIVSGGSDRTVRVWDSKTGKVVAGPFEGHTRPVSSVAFSPDGQQIVSGSLDHTVCLWDVKKGKVVARPFEGHTDRIFSIAFSPNGQQFFSVSGDRTVRIWDAKTGDLLAGPLEGHTGLLWPVAFSPNGQQIVSGGSERTIRVWNSKTGELAGPFKGHTRPVSSVVFSPDGRQIASGSSDQTVRVWDAKTGEVVAGPFEGHMGRILSVAFSPNGQQFVSGSEDLTVRVWDAKTGNILAGPFEGHTGRVWSVAFSPDGQQIASGSSDQTVRVWSVKMGEAAMQWDTDYLVHSYRGARLINGWMRGRNCELLFWIPPYYRIGLWGPHTTAIMGRQTTKLDLSQFVHGTSWAQCHTHGNFIGLT